MAICQFYQRGYCKFGDRCRYEHPNAGGGFQNQNQNQNRFGALANPPNNRRGGDSYRPGQHQQQQQQHQQPGRQQGGGHRYPGLDAETIRTDLTVERPIWPFSVYGPGKNAPRQIIEAQNEQSFEEVRLHYYLAKQNNSVQLAEQNEQREFNRVQGEVSKILENLGAAVKYILDGENVHPNRVDLCNEVNAKQQQPPQARNPFGGAQPPAAPSGFGKPQGGFGAPSFGQTSQPQASGFGRPTPLGQGGAFGQPSAPAFGQPTPAGGGFGRPAFGQPAAPAQGAGFGQPAFGGNNNASASPFGGNNANPSPFGQAAPAAPAAQAPAFGQPAFGTPANQPAFGNPGGFGQPAGAPPPQNPFAAAAANNNVNNASPFGQAAQQQAPSPFGQASQPSTQAPFGAAPQSPVAVPFGNAAKPAATPFSAFGQPQAQQPPMTNGVNGVKAVAAADGSHITRDPRTGQVTRFNGNPVKYVDGTPYWLRNPSDPNSLERIFFPDGPPKPNPWTMGKPEDYTEAVTQAYKFALETGGWKDNVMPEVPPSYELNVWTI